MAEYELSPWTKQMERVDAKVPIGTTLTSSATVNIADEYVPVDATSGAVVVGLPESNQANRGKQYEISKRDSSGNTVTIDPFGSDTINGSATLIISFRNSTAHIVCNGDGTWSVI
jgi:hypothetical protein